jgi:hypothetical protein
MAISRDLNLDTDDNLSINSSKYNVQKEYS